MCAVPTRPGGTDGGAAWRAVATGAGHVGRASCHGRAAGSKGRRTGSAPGTRALDGRLVSAAPSREEKNEMDAVHMKKILK
eukprot:scaffold428_cov105-Isochrysis_galbana.AAC.3